MVILQAESLLLRRDQRALVQDVSVAVHAGEILMLVGPNGAGKSSLLKILAGEWRPDVGHVSLYEKRLNEWAPQQLALRRAVMPQHSPLTFPFRVHQVVAFGRTPHDTGVQEDSRIVEHWLQACDVSHLAESPYTQLSGGEKQRVHWARIMAQLSGVESPLLLMDEPTSALDLSHQYSLMALLRARAAQGLGAVVAVHDLNLAARFGDRIIMMKAGRVEALGSPAEVFTPEIVESVFGVKVSILPHPEGGFPLVVV